MRVFDDEHPGLPAGQRGRVDHSDDPPTPRIGGDFGQSYRRVANSEQVVEQLQVLCICLGETNANPSSCRVSVEIGNTRDCAQEAGNHVERDVAGVRFADCGEQLDSTFGGCLRNIAHQTGLADACLSNDPDDTAVARNGTVQEALDSRHLPPPTDEARRGAGDRAMLIAHAQQPAGGNCHQRHP